MTGAEDGPVGYAIDPEGTASHTAVLESLVQGIDHDTLRDTIGEYGLEAVAEHYLQTLLRERMVHASAYDADRAAAELHGTDLRASPRVHEVTVADLADLFTRLGLTDPP